MLVDDEWLVRAGLRTMLDGADGIEIVAEAPSGRDVERLVVEHRVDVVLMDIRMPDVDGIAATAAVRALPDAPQVIMLTTFDANDLVLRALRAGASGFLVKDTPPREIVDAVTRVHGGDPILSPSVTRGLIKHVNNAAERPSGSAAADRFDSLTAAEQRVAVTVARGLSNADIAAELFISVATVKSHISHILDKLQFNNRVQVALLVHDARPDLMV